MITTEYNDFKNTVQSLVSSNVKETFNLVKETAQSNNDMLSLSADTKEFFGAYDSTEALKKGDIPAQINSFFKVICDTPIPDLNTKVLGVKGGDNGYQLAEGSPTEFLSIPANTTTIIETLYRQIQLEIPSKFPLFEMVRDEVVSGTEVKGRILNAFASICEPIQYEEQPSTQQGIGLTTFSASAGMWGAKSIRFGEAFITEVSSLQDSSKRGINEYLEIAVAQVLYAIMLTKAKIITDSFTYGYYVAKNPRTGIFEKNYMGYEPDSLISFDWGTYDPSNPIANPVVADDINPLDDLYSLFASNDPYILRTKGLVNAIYLNSQTAIPLVKKVSLDNMGTALTVGGFQSSNKDPNNPNAPENIVSLVPTMAGIKFVIDDTVVAEKIDNLGRVVPYRLLPTGYMIVGTSTNPLSTPQAVFCYTANARESMNTGIKDPTISNSSIFLQVLNSTPNGGLLGNGVPSWEIRGGFNGLFYDPMAKSRFRIKVYNFVTA